jgi:alkanesulfonate monooxygenase SsuD/methylene tetrahydromethanopterin reductase-like flavin-dependent oxidoreductase (luciferase family)
MLSHHFTDYCPSPSPMFFLSHIAATCPGLGLGTAVIVLPWCEPVRFAEEVVPWFRSGMEEQAAG